MHEWVRTALFRQNIENKCAPFKFWKHAQHKALPFVMEEHEMPRYPVSTPSFPAGFEVSYHPYTNEKSNAADAPLVVVSLPDQTTHPAKRKRNDLHKYLFRWQVEVLLCGCSVTGSNVSSLYGQFKSKGNLRDLITIAHKNQKAQYTLNTVEDNYLNAKQFKALKTVYMDMVHSYDPLAGPAKRFGIIPLQTCIWYARDRKSVPFLKALGQDIPPSMIPAPPPPSDDDDVSVGSDSDDEVNVDDCDDLAQTAGNFHIFGKEVEDTREAPVELPSKYALKPVPVLIRAELEEYKKFRMAELNAFREGGGVTDTTVDNDISCALRFLGYMKAFEKAFLEEILDGEKMTIERVYGHKLFAVKYQEYLNWIRTERNNKWSTCANYCSSAINMLNCVMTRDDHVMEVTRSKNAHEMITALRAQCDKQAKVEHKYNKKNPNWIDWGESLWLCACLSLPGTDRVRV